MTGTVLTEEDVMARWTATKRFVQDEARAGNLPGFKVGGHWRFREEAVTAYELAREQAAKPAPAFTSVKTRRRAA